MAGRLICPSCVKENSSENEKCRYCGTVLQGSADDFAEEAGEHENQAVSSGNAGESANFEQGEEKSENEMEDEFAELDYRPKRKPKMLVSLAAILFTGAIIAGGIYYMGDFSIAPVAELEENGREEDLHEEDLAEEDDLPEEPEDPEPVEEVDPEEDEEEEEQEQKEEEEEVPPDYDKLEPVMVDWLEERVEDPEVILLPVEKLEDSDAFFEEYDLAEDLVIIYRIEDREDEFATVLFGPPYSEWSTKAVFIWEDSEWRFLREEQLE